MGHNCWWWCDPSHPQVLAEEEVGQGLSTALSKAEGFLLVCLFVEFWIRPARSLACIPEMSCHGVRVCLHLLCAPPDEYICIMRVELAVWAATVGLRGLGSHCSPWTYTAMYLCLFIVLCECHAK